MFNKEIDIEKMIREEKDTHKNIDKLYKKGKITLEEACMLDMLGDIFYMDKHYNLHDLIRKDWEKAQREDKEYVLNVYNNAEAIVKNGWSLIKLHLIDIRKRKEDQNIIIDAQYLNFYEIYLLYESIRDYYEERSGQKMTKEVYLRLMRKTLDSEWRVWSHETSEKRSEKSYEAILKRTGAKKLEKETGKKYVLDKEPIREYDDVDLSNFYDTLLRVGPVMEEKFVNPEMDITEYYEYGCFKCPDGSFLTTPYLKVWPDLHVDEVIRKCEQIEDSLIEQ